MPYAPRSREQPRGEIEGRVRRVRRLSRRLQGGPRRVVDEPDFEVCVPLPEPVSPLAVRPRARQRHSHADRHSGGPASTARAGQRP